MSSEFAGERVDGSSGSGDDPGQDVFSIQLDWRRWWTILPEIATILCTAALPVVVTANVISRYTGLFQVRWAADIIQVLFLWIIFLGGATAVRYGAHVRMALISSRIAGRPGQVWDAVIRLSPVAMGVILIVLGVPLVELSTVRELPSLQISSGYFMVVVPISGALMVIYSLVWFARGRRYWRTDR